MAHQLVLDIMSWTLLHHGSQWSGSAVLNLLRLDDHLQILSLGRGPPLKIVPWKIEIIVCLCVYIITK